MFKIFMLKLHIYHICEELTVLNDFDIRNHLKWLITDMYDKCEVSA